MAVSQSDIALQMLAQLRLLDPSVSAEVGTPERKILDTVASALADAQVDLVQLSGSLDVDAKTGSNLDNFLALFGFGRQQAVKATGFVEFSVTDPSTTDIRIPTGTQIMAPQVPVGSGNTTQNVIFETTFDVTLLAGQLSIFAPIRAITAGSLGNVAANTINSWAGAIVFGIHEINNPAPMTAGVDQEDDNTLKARFKNTVFRNLAGTQDQFLALAASAAFTTKVNVVGPVSRYREYIQVPKVDDASSIDVDGEPSGPEPGNGSGGEYSTALSTIPYSKHIYSEVPTFVSNGGTGASSIFWRQDLDWILNIDNFGRNRGDAYRLWNNDGVAPHLGPDPQALASANKPSVTFTNVYTGTNDGVTAVRPGDTLLFEHTYMSTSSRNDWVHNVTNCVDVFIDGTNDTVSNTVVPAPGVSIAHALVAAPDTSKFYFDNFRRDGEPDVAPTPGHLFIPLFWQPVTTLPASITIFDDTDTATYFLNEHYWLITDQTELYGTVRARNGIEWDATLAGSNSAGNSERIGLALRQFPSGTPITIENYVFDKNIVDLQANLESAKQTTTDVLVHRARLRYFKLDITVMYSPGSNPSQTNSQIRSAVADFFAGDFFGNTIQLSDLLQTIHQVNGVDNVRWSSDVPGNDDLNRLVETNRFGINRLNLVYNSDFTLQDDELPALAEQVDEAEQNSRLFATEPGLIIRARAQNTWTSSA